MPRKTWGKDYLALMLFHVFFHSLCLSSPECPSLAQERKNVFLWLFKQAPSALRGTVQRHRVLRHDPTVSLNTAFRCVSLDGCMDSGLLACTIKAPTLFCLILLSCLNTHTHLIYIMPKVAQCINIKLT